MAFPPLYLITDSSIAGAPHIAITKKAVSAGVKIIQLRDKHLDQRQFYEQCLKVREHTKKNRTLFIVNDYIDIAMAVSADGVHLGQDDIPLAEARKLLGKNKIIGISTHTLKQAKAAEEGGADYIGFGPMYSTITKDAGRPKGLAMLRKIRKEISIPIVAIGGITEDNFLATLEAGADSCAVISGIMKGDIILNIKKYIP
ncbi:MAG: thiamine phosphate synthase [Nitrospira sp.]|nr:thiamine phosphate synthase [Nitrospira sp.]